MNQNTGSCLCGKVRFSVSGEPARVGICHCLDCKKHHGALFYAAAIFPEGAVTLEGQTNAFQGRCFCPHCGSSVFARTGEEIEIHLGSFDAPDQFIPTYECWTARREPWLPRFSDTECFLKDRDTPLQFEDLE